QLFTADLYYLLCFFFSSRRRHTRSKRDWSSDVCSSDLKAFVENELPFFIDQANTMSHHPILEFINSLFLLKKNHYRLDDVFRFLRTELFIPDYDGQDTSKEAYQKQINEWRQKIDIAENVALAYG